MGQILPAATEAGGVLIKFKNNTSKFNQRKALRSAGCRGVTSFSLVKGLTFARITASITSQQTIDLLLRDPNVEYAEPNINFTTAATPNDPRFNSLYGLHNTGQTGGSNDADIDAVEAWDIQTGSDIIVAVLDTGVDYNHPDLSANIWSNGGEIPNNGLDDDNNGYVDDVRGWDFANSDNNPMDDNNHGTHVSGTIAARGNNGTGITGVNWSARVMPLKFMNAAGVGNLAGAISAIQYAIDNGARVINASWGGPGFSNALNNAVGAANNAGILFVAAAGNNSANTDVSPNYPAGFNQANILSVAATDATDGLAGFSNFGANSVDLGAPGVSILSTIRNNGYASFNGTSMAAPHVAGAAALILASNPTMSLSALKNTIMNSTDPIAALAGRSVSGGRLNVFNAVSSIATPAPAPVPVPVTIAVSPGSANLIAGTNLQFSASGGLAPYSWTISNAALASISTTGLLTTLAAGTLTVTATDANGNSGSSGFISINQLQITPDTATINTGTTLQFSASGGTTPYTWSVSNTTVASISATSGLLTALVPGPVIVSVTDNAGNQTSSNAINIVSLGLTPMNAALTVGDALTFSASGGTPPYSWSSSNSLVAAIGATTGTLSALAVGSTSVSVVDNNGLTATSNLISVAAAQAPVPPPPPAPLSLTPQSSVLGVGQTLQFNASGGLPPYIWRSTITAVGTVNDGGMLTGLSPGSINISITDAAGASLSSGAITVRRIDVTPATASVVAGNTMSFSASGGNAPYSWSTSDSNVAIINANGLLTALNPGSTVVIATDVDGANSIASAVTVTSPPVQLNITPQSGILVVGDNVTFTATGSTAALSWASSNPAIASIDANGLLTVLSPGIFVVTVNDSNGNSGSSGIFSVLAAAPVIAVSPNTATVDTGTTLQFSATGGTTVAYTWSSSDPTLASFDASGLLTAITPGTIMVTATDGNGFTGVSGTITVQNPAPPPPILISPDNANLAVGDSLALSASGNIFGMGITWTSSDPTIATVTSTGFSSATINALTSGSITITATNFGNTVTVGPFSVTAPASPLSLTPTVATVDVGANQTFSASGGTAPYTWSLNNTAVASIDNVGVLTGISAGFVVVTVTDATGTSISTGNITVVAPVAAVSVSPQTATLLVGNTQQFSATGGALPYTWLVNNGTVASIDANGVLTGLTPGIVVVTAMDANGITGSTSSITISDMAQVVTVTPQTGSISTGATLQFTASGGNNMYTWTTDNGTVASVDANGLLTGINVGSVFVTATDGNGNSGSSGAITITAGGMMR